jgi:hypothetical protein
MIASLPPLSGWYCFARPRMALQKGRWVWCEFRHLVITLDGPTGFKSPTARWPMDMEVSCYPGWTSSSPSATP